MLLKFEGDRLVFNCGSRVLPGKTSLFVLHTPTTSGSLLTSQPLLWVRHFYDVPNKHSVTVQLKCSTMAWCLNFRAPVANICLVVFS